MNKDLDKARAIEMPVCTLTTGEFGEVCRAHPDNPYTIHVELNAENLNKVSGMWGMVIHGDWLDYDFSEKGIQKFDIEFPTLGHACQFESVWRDDCVIEFRSAPPADFTSPVTLTVWQRAS